jgi:hypothetical protein
MLSRLGIFDGELRLNISCSYFKMPLQKEMSES